MKWTFGIITTGNNEENLSKVVNSILLQDIIDYEIIIVGNTKIQGSKIKNIFFDESIKPGWITRKKNLIAETAKFKCLSIHHDYVTLDKNWYKYFLEFGDDWDVCMTRIETLNGKRFRDWVIWDESQPHKMFGNDGKIQYLSYTEDKKTNQQYISGTYFCVKRDYLLRNKLDERRSWSESEDVEWSLRMRNSWKLRCNWKSKVVFCKEKDLNPIENPHEKEYETIKRHYDI